LPKSKTEKETKMAALTQDQFDNAYDYASLSRDHKSKFMRDMWARVTQQKQITGAQVVVILRIQREG